MFNLLILTIRNLFPPTESSPPLQTAPKIPHLRFPPRSPKMSGRTVLARLKHCVR